MATHHLGFDNVLKSSFPLVANRSTCRTIDWKNLSQGLVIGQDQDRDNRLADQDSFRIKVDKENHGDDQNTDV